MQKNTAGKWVVFAYGLPDHANDGQPITGDAANITANMRIDGAAANAIDDTNPTELEDGYYIFDITAAEANGDLLLLTPQSGTSNVQVIGVPGTVWTRPPNFEALGIESDGDLTKCNLVATTTANTDMRGTDSAATSAKQDTMETTLNDVPTTAEFEARTLVAASYFDPAADTVATVTDVTNGATSAKQDTMETTLNDVPTTAEFEARTLVAASYFDPAADTVATVTDVTNQVTVADILTTQMTEAYAADGAAPTLAQALMMIQQMLGEFSISGTTLTMKKVDGSTTGATFTLNDGTNPTSLTRAS